MALSMTQLMRQAAEARKAEKAVRDGAASVTPINIRQEEPASYGVLQTEQPNRAPISGTHIGHPKRTPEPSTQTEQPSRTAKPNAQSEPDSQSGHPSRTAKPNTRIEHPIRTLEPGIQTEQPKPNLIKLCPRNEATTLAQKTLLRYFQINGAHVSNYDLIATETGVPRGTVRRVTEKFVGLGMLEKRPWRDGNKQGVYFNLLHNRAPESNTRIEHPDQTPEPSTRTEHPLPPLKRDRKEDLSISQETLETAWPSLARAGFGTDQLAQIARSLAEQGKATDKVVQGLDHAEWELAAGKMLDKEGRAVADPCAWVFRSLASAGYYRRPAGYVSPAEQAERDAEDEARAVAERREKARQARFEAWVKGLPPQERKDALQGRMGPEKEWLKKVWIERGEPL